MSLRKPLILLFLFPLILFGQQMFTVDREIINTGVHELFSGIIDSIKITNPSDDVQYVFATTKSREFEYRLPKKGIGPNESDYIYFISHPKKKGAFELARIYLLCQSLDVAASDLSFNTVIP